MRIISYNYNKISATTSYDDYLYIAFYTNPGLIIKVSKTTPDIIIDTFSLGNGYYNIKSLYVDAVYIYVICDFNETGTNELIRINHYTKATNIYSLDNTHPIKIIGNNNYLVVLCNGDINSICIYQKSNMTLLQEYTFDTSEIVKDICMDSSANIWGTLYNESEGKFFKLEVDSSITWSYNEYEQSTYTKLNKIYIDALENIYITTLEDLGSLFKCQIETSGAVYIERDITLSTDTGEISSINMDSSDNIWLGTSAPAAIIKLWEISGATYDYTSYGETLLPSDITSQVIETGTKGIYLGVYSNPGKLMIQDLKEKLNISSKFITRRNIYNRFLCKIAWVYRTFLKIGTKFITRITSTTKISTNLKWFLQRYNEITPKPIDNLHVYLDGVELTDYNVETLVLSFSLNNNPSTLNMELYRYHDNFNYTVSGVLSTIDEENKITVYDGTKLLFTGYITVIDANSESENVTITAEDIRYKLSKISYKKYDPSSTRAMDDGYVYEIEYGGKYNTDTNSYTMISTKTALEEIFTLISSYISGYDTIEFGFIPEYTTTESDYASLINTLVSISGNYNWYVDENEKIRFQKIESGNIIDLQMSDIAGRRNLYDILVNNITLNRKTSDYYTSFYVCFGKRHYRQYVRGQIQYFSEYRRPSGIENAKEYMLLEYQKNGLSRWYYDYSGYIYIKTITSFPVNLNYDRYYQAQYLLNDSYVDIPPVKIGTGNLTKRVDYSSYGYKLKTSRLEEKTFDESTKFGAISTYTWLCETIEDYYDYRNYALDNAYFDLSQNNKLITEANISIILDAFNFYNIDFKKRINIINTVDPTIYKNNNGFPLNIESYSINLGTRLVTLNTTNYGKSFYQRSGNYINTYRPEKTVKVSPKLPGVIFTGEA